MDFRAVATHVDVLTVTRFAGLEDLAEEASLTMAVTRLGVPVGYFVAMFPDDLFPAVAGGNEEGVIHVGDSVVAVIDNDVLVQGIHQCAKVAFTLLESFFRLLLSSVLLSSTLFPIFGLRSRRRA